MDQVIHQHARLTCSIDRAWELFTSSSQLENWLAARANVDIRVGGSYELFWNPENPDSNSTIGCRITALEHEQLIAFEWKGAAEHDSFMNSVRPLTHVVVSFVPVTTHETVVHLVHSGWRIGADWDSARAWFERAWSMAFIELERLAAAIGSN